MLTDLIVVLKSWLQKMANLSPNYQILHLKIYHNWSIIEVLFLDIMDLSNWLKKQMVIGIEWK
jgi:hypothetical protein